MAIIASSNTIIFTIPLSGQQGDVIYTREGEQLFLCARFKVTTEWPQLSKSLATIPNDEPARPRQPGELPAAITQRPPKHALYICGEVFRAGRNDRRRRRLD